MKPSPIVLDTELRTDASPATLAGAEALCDAFARGEGFGFFLLSCRFYAGGQPRTPVGLTNLDGRFMHRYLRRGWGAVDELQQRAGLQVAPFAFRVCDFAPPACELAEGFRAHGIEGGLVVPLHGPQGEGITLMLGGSDEVEIGSDAGRALCARVWEFLVALYPSLALLLGSASTPKVDLSERERTILTMIAHGQSIKVISSTLALSPKTITNGIEALCRKLGVVTREQAIALAVQAGAITVMSGNTDDSSIFLAGI